MNIFTTKNVNLYALTPRFNGKTIKTKVLVKLLKKLAVSKGAFQGVNFKTVRWTVLKEGTLCK